MDPKDPRRRWRFLQLLAAILFVCLLASLGAGGSNFSRSSGSIAANLQPARLAEAPSAYPDALISDFPQLSGERGNGTTAESPFSAGQGGAATGASPTAMPSPSATVTPTRPAMVAPTGTVVPRPSGTLSSSIRVPILMYHYIRVNPVATDTLGFALSVTPDNFERQAAYLVEQGYHSMTVDDLAGVLRGERQLPPKPIVLTFDDGYNDFYTAAFPVLRKYDLRATSFIITGMVGRPAYMTWETIGELSRTGLVSFGSHAVSHPDLAKIPLDRAASELKASKADLELHLGTRVRSFCYPSGQFNAQVANLVRDAGYDAAVTEISGATQSVSDPFTLKRIRMDGRDSFSGFMSKLLVR